MSSEAEDVIYKAAMTFKHEELAGMYSLCSKREQRHEKEIQRLQQQVKVLREALEDFRDCGTRHDINPTGMFKSCGCFQSMNGDSWQGYIKSQDEYVRDRARQALKGSEE